MTIEANNTVIRAVIVDDHGIVRQGLRALLSQPGIEVVGEAESGNEAVRLAQSIQPDVMLLDIRMKDGDGLQSLPQIKAASPKTSVIILTTYASTAYLAKAISGGAAGFRIWFLLPRLAESRRIIAHLDIAVGLGDSPVG